MALEQLSIVLGAVLGFWTGFATRDGAWFSLALRLRIDFFPQLTMLRLWYHRRQSTPPYLGAFRSLYRSSLPSSC